MLKGNFADKEGKKYRPCFHNDEGESCFSIKNGMFSLKGGKFGIPFGGLIKLKVNYNDNKEELDKFMNFMLTTK